ARKIVSELNRLRVDGKAGKEGLNNTDPEEARPESERKELPKNSKAFDLTYGFYVLMGGFVVSIEEIHDNCTMARITPRGARCLARHGHFLEITPETISDKSKVNAVGKGL
ncbi:hypothetical protein DH86_00002842, partial [Scytalidium sp. 3C]